jgi:hypothetical protein
VAFAPGVHGTLAILLPAVDDDYEVYWNGRLIGSRCMPPLQGLFQRSHPRSFILGPPEPGVLAIRVWKVGFGSFDSGLQGGLESAPVIGSTRAIATALDALDYTWLRGQQLNFALTSLYALVGLASLIVWLRDRRQWLVLWMVGFAFSHVLAPAIMEGLLPFSNGIASALASPFFSIGDVSLWFLLVWLLELNDVSRLMRVVTVAAVIDMAAAVPDAFVGIGTALPNPVPWQWADAVFTLPQTVFQLAPFFIISVALARHARLDPVHWMVALIAFFTQLVFTCIYALEQGSRFTHWTLGNKIAAPLFTAWGAPVKIDHIAGTLLLIALAYAVYRYTSENTRRQAALKQELENARVVQHVLVPTEIPRVPGFKIESVYKPAGEVGGDFSQILALDDGSVLIIIGDVSGKGMPAAMTVSLLVGVVRTLSHYTQKPGEILAAMNQGMLGRQQGGFTTCLVLRADADGRLTVANAGHLAPYLDGAELAIENGFPLGLDPRSIYREATFQLSPGAQLTLLTDGVVEARSSSGALFGFDQALAISTQPAESIAQQAQSCGLEDDITVLTLTRVAAPEPVLNSPPTPNLAAAGSTVKV